MNNEKPDHELAREELAAFFNARGHIPNSVIRVGVRKDSNNWEHTLWWVSFLGTGFNYKTGMGFKGRPEAYEVLACVCSDWHSAISAGCFELWADEFGYDSDSRKAEKIYRECLDLAERLRQIGLTRAEITTLANLHGRF